MISSPPGRSTRFISATESQKCLSCSSVESTATRSNESSSNTSCMSLALPVTVVMHVVARHVDEVQAEALGAVELREAQERLVAHDPADLERPLRPDAAPADQLVELLHDLGTHGREPTDF